MDSDDEGWESVSSDEDLQGSSEAKEPTTPTTDTKPPGIAAAAVEAHAKAKKKTGKRGKQGKKKAVKRSPEEVAASQTHHRSHLLMLLAHSIGMYNISQQGMLQDALMALLPPELKGRVAAACTTCDGFQVPSDAVVRDIVSFYSFRVTVVAAEDMARPTLSLDSLATEFSRETVSFRLSEDEDTVSCLALLSALGCKCRLISSLDAKPVALNAAKLGSKARLRSKQTSQGPLRHWIEVASLPQRRIDFTSRALASVEDESMNEVYWMPLSPSRDIKRASDLERPPCRPLTRPFLYVLGLGGVRAEAFTSNNKPRAPDGLVLGWRDVTARYTSKYSQVLKLRRRAGTDEWWKAVLVDCSNRFFAALECREELPKALTPEVLARIEKERWALEEESMQISRLQEALPTSKEAYKAHPLYCLEAQLGKYEVLRPRHPVLGIFKGQPVYPRSSVRRLRSQMGWKMQGRQVLESELPHPVKTIKQTARARAGHGGKGGGRGPMSEIELLLALTQREERAHVPLFGRWQTAAIDPGDVIDGIIPTNDHGNVEVWTEDCVPRGGVLLALPRAQKVAQRLGINSAPAVTGFEFKKGGMKPKIEGIVIAKEHKVIFEDAYAIVEQERLEKAAQRRMKVILKRWETLANGLLITDRIMATYGKEEEEEGGAEGNTRNGSAATKEAMAPSNAASTSGHHGNKSDKANKGDKANKPSKRQRVEPGACKRHKYDVVAVKGGVSLKRCVHCGFELEFEEIQRCWRRFEEVKRLRRDSACEHCRKLYQKHACVLTQDVEQPSLRLRAAQRRQRLGFSGLPYGTTGYKAAGVALSPQWHQ